MKYLGVMALAAITLLASSMASAQSLNQSAPPYEEAASFSAWNNSFLVNQGGQTYYTDTPSSVNSGQLGGYGEALDIAVAEDNYQATHSPATLQLVTNLINSFGSLNGTDWSGDTYNDDLGWMVNAYLRAYKITGNPNYLSIAELNWNTAYTRGWDSVLGGGIYENMQNKYDKLCLSNDNFVWEGVGIYEATGDASYLTKAENIYAWVRTHIFNPTNATNAVGAPGALCQGETINGVLEGGEHAYNSGSFLIAANALYQVTGNAEYYNDAVLDINHEMSLGPVMHDGAEDGGSQYQYLFVKGLSQFCTNNNLWPTYYPWLLANANQAWQDRNNANLTWNDWTNTTDSNPANDHSLAMSSAVGIWQLLDVPQQYQIINEKSGLAMDLLNGGVPQGQVNNAPIEQYSPEGGDANQLWSVIPTPDGANAIISGQTGMAATISFGATQAGYGLVDWPYGVGNTSLEFKLNPQGSGLYQIQNINSGLVLDDAGGSTSPVPIIQNPATGGPSQNWKFTPITSFGGNYELQCAASNDALGVKGNSTANGAAVVQTPYSGAAGQMWTFVPTSMGYYEIINVNSAQDLNVVSNSFFGSPLTTPADICQWPGGDQAADQWLPVQNPNGTYSFYNLNSGLVLDDPGFSDTAGTQFQQYLSNGGANQQFNLIPAAATVAGVSANWGRDTAVLTAGSSLLPAGRTTDVPWSGISSFTVTLSAPEALTAADVSVTGLNGTIYGPVTVTGSGSSYTLTLAKPITAADVVTLSIGSAGITSFSGLLPVLPGDITDDGAVNASDLTFARNMFENRIPSTIYGDLNGEGTVSISDYMLVRQHLANKLP